MRYLRNVRNVGRAAVRSTAVLSILVWLILPVLVELRPPGDWEVPLGTVLNADPEPPWPASLHDGLSKAFVGALDPESMVLLPGPTVQVAAAALVEPPSPRVHRRFARAADLLTLHRRRNE